MSFHEKSAWVMSLSLFAAGALYFKIVQAMSAEAGALAPPVLPTIVVATIALVVLAAGGHIVLALFTPKEASAALDEREKKIAEKASNWSGNFFGAGVILALGFYLFHHHGDLLFYTVLLSLLIGQWAEYMLQILFYRSRV